MFFEDVELGETFESGSWTFTEEEIISFAKNYDPQPFHVDPAFAATHEFGGIVASGFHIGSIWMKLMVEKRQKDFEEMTARGETFEASTAGVSPGFRKMRWHLPVRPGDTLTFTSTIWRRVAMGSRTDVGIVENKSVGVNQKGETAFSFIGKGLYPRRPK